MKRGEVEQHLMFKDLIQVLNPQLPVYLDCGVFFFFFIKVVGITTANESFSGLL